MKTSLVHEGKDEGNELTGQAAAWVFVAANLPAAVGLLSRQVTQRTSLGTKTKDRIKRFNQFQKKHLMRFHYILNPLALLLAFIHFLLSNCRTNSLPEWALAGAAIVVGIGMVIKLKLSPMAIRRGFYRIHTNPVPMPLLLAILLLGHGMMD